MERCKGELEFAAERAAGADRFDGCSYVPYVGYVTIAMVSCAGGERRAELILDSAQNDFPKLKYALLGVSFSPAFAASLKTLTLSRRCWEERSCYIGNENLFVRWHAALVASKGSSAFGIHWDEIEKCSLLGAALFVDICADRKKNSSKQLSNASGIQFLEALQDRSPQARIAQGVRAPQRAP